MVQEPPTPLHSGPPSEPPPPADDFSMARRATPLGRIISEQITRDGRITFERFMSLALAHPQHGYYSREGLRWGADGDYETSPEVHPIFGYLWARQIEQCWDRLGRPRPFYLIEAGAGSGAFSTAMLTWLRERAPACASAVRAVLLDGHPHRLAQQRLAVEAPGLRAEHHLLETWLADTPPVTGVVISNELLDALPVHLVERRGPTLHEWYVAHDATGGLRFEIGPLSSSALAERFEALGLRSGDGCRAEVSLAATTLMQRIARRIERGYVLTIDYGYEADALYAPWRRMGTLMAFRNHSPQPDPLAMPGLTDLTAHVDFTSLAATGGAAGLTAAPTVSQAEALVGLGLGEALAAASETAATDAAAYVSARRASEVLLDPAGLGRIRVLAQAKDAPLDGLRCLSAAG